MASRIGGRTGVEKKVEYVPKNGSNSAVRADGRKARPAPRGVQLNVVSTKMGIV
jgi:hypothetical protein